MRSIPALPSLFVATALAAGVLLHPGPVRAQAAADSTGRPIYGFLRPTYTTSYSMLQSSQASWVQGFSFQNTFGGVNVTNRTNYTINTDSKRADFRQKTGNTDNALTFLLLNRLTTSANVSFTRTGTNDTGRRTEQDLFNTGLKTSYTLKPIRGASSTISGGMGFQRRNDSFTGGGFESGSREVGLTRDLSTNSFYLGPLPDMKFTLATQSEAVRTSPKAIGTTSQPGANDPRTNTRSSTNFNWSYNPTSTLSATAGYATSSAKDQYIFVSPDTTKAGRQEKQITATNNLTLGLDYQHPTTKTIASAAFSTGKTDLSRAVDVDRASDRTSNDFNVKLQHNLAGTLVIAHFEQSKDHEVPATRVSNSILTRVLDGTLDRTLTSHVAVKLVGELRLRSQVYSDTLQDKDTLKKRAEITVSYTPMSRLTASLNGKRVNTDDVSVHPSVSRNTRLEENFGLYGSLDYRLTGRTRISQTYSFSEIFASYRLNPRQDNLARTRDIGTTISSLLTSRVTLTLTHAYQLRETGGYRREGGVRNFLKDELRYTQDLSTAVDYQPVTWLHLTTRERFYRTDIVKVGSGARLPNSRLELTQMMHLERPLPGGGTLTGDFTYFRQGLLLPAAGKSQQFLTTTVQISKTF